MDVQIHTKAKGMNEKSFPMYDSWQILFGKDRATGEFAEDPEEIQDEAGNETLEIDDDFFTETYIPRYENGDPVNLDSCHDSNVNPSTPRANASPSTPISNVGVLERPKKKAKGGKEVFMVEAIKGIMGDTNECLTKIAEAVAHDNDASKRRMGVFEELLKLD